MDIDANDLRWQDRAKCHGLDLDLFFGPIGEGAADRAIREPKAKAVCARCPVRTNCLDYAIERGDKSGIWGGMDADERRTLDRKLKRRARTAAA